MLPAMCRNDACMNIAVKTVCHAGSVPTELIWATVPSGSVWPLQKTPIGSGPEIVC